jgi:inhibitor of KinA
VDWVQTGRSGFSGEQIVAGRIQFELAPLGDTAVEVRWQGLDDQALISANVAAVRLFEQRPCEGVIAVVPGFLSLTIHYDPLVWNGWEEIHRRASGALSELEATTLESRIVELPVCYSDNYALDLEAVVASTGLTSREVIRRHSGAEYIVRMLGFMPGFPYLAGLPTELQVPRKDRPRLNAPAGSVAIAGDQAGIYPVVSPGGWQIIGRTPVRLFNPHATNPSLLRPGDRVRFRQVSAEEYLEIERAAE